MTEHEHTEWCASTSRYSLVRVDAVVEKRSITVRVRMKPSATCWSDTDLVGRVVVPNHRGLPTSPEHAAEIAAAALREAYPGLF